ncbi:hypothetical protein GCM10009601_47320 [Streptomyces thermospinosisporus]|uniref:Uncharacterized protein n=1 Tax=Streptomyces thermospinosisporus TaxID=161482 RepID=A0ABP4JUB0_9ACTN
MTRRRAVLVGLVAGALTLVTLAPAMAAPEPRTHIGFSSGSSQLVAGDTNGSVDGFLRRLR